MFGTGLELQWGAQGVSLRIEEERFDRVDHYATISIAFSVERILEVSGPEGGLRGIQLDEVRLDKPWIKDYDAIDGGAPAQWSTRFDTSSWGLIAAYDGDTRIGGAAIAPGLEAPGRAALWDLRVRPASRSTGVGSELFRAVEEWTRTNGCTQLTVETQNINLAACRFYARMGCELMAIDRYAYPDFPNETLILWIKDLASTGSH